TTCFAGLFVTSSKSIACARLVGKIGLALFKLGYSDRRRGCRDRPRDRSRGTDTSSSRAPGYTSRRCTNSGLFCPFVFVCAVTIRKGDTLIVARHNTAAHPDCRATFVGYPRPGP